MTELEQRVMKLEAALEEARGDVDLVDLRDAVLALRSTVGKLEATVAALETEVRSLGGALDDVRDDVEDMCGDR